MKTHVISVVSALAFTGAAVAQLTSFTYQGRLKNGAQAASGPHDFRFRLFDAASGGAQIGATQCVDNVPVTGGLFAATIDFGQQFATPAPRFLEIDVRADSGLICSNATGFVALGPRQPLTTAPLASHANSAFALDAPDGSPVNAVFVDNAGRIGIGTTSPGSFLDIQGANGSNVLFGRGAGGGLAHNLYIDSAGNGSMQLIGSTGTPRVEFANGLTYFNYGNVGIGTSNPLAKLEVRGDIRLGVGGQLRAVSGTENLYIVRGRVAANGSIVGGSGTFTCQFNGISRYDITYTTPFADLPSVTATCVVSTVQDDCITMTINPSSTGVSIFIKPSPGFNGARPFDFIAIGPR